MAQKTLWLHIGLPRCGTTALQTLLMNVGLIENLKQQAGLLLSDYGTTLWRDILNEISGLGFTDQHNVWQFFADTPVVKLPQATQSFRDAVSELKSSPQDTHVWTAEGLATLTFMCGRGVAESWFAETVSGTDPDVDIRLILFVRRQDTFIESYYSHSVKRGNGKTFEHFFDTFDGVDLDWHRLASGLLALERIAEIKVIPYDGGLLQAHKQMNYFEAFFDAMGHRVSIPVDPNDRNSIRNPSIPMDLLDLARYANATLPVERALAVNEMLSQSFAKTLNSSYSLMSDEQRQHVRDRYRDSNSKLFQEFLPWAPADSYEDSPKEFAPAGA